MVLDRRALDLAERADGLARELVTLSMQEDTYALGHKLLEMMREPEMCAIVSTRLAGMVGSLVEALAVSFEITPEEMWSRIAVEGASIMQNELQRRRDAL